ncbi:MAG: hypothetical protein KDD25_02650 [Bdellovibrionales bacterium]|nr:hypothetical protein [Bdellovibrionales bacterium]
MKLTIAALLFCIIGTNQSAHATDVVLSEKVSNLTVDISTAKLKLSKAGYESPVVKVLVPDLADVTIFDHRNEGEGAPCLATFDTFEPNDVIQGNPSVEEIPFKVTLTRMTFLDSANVCQVYLVENVEGQIRGFNFYHSRDAHIGTRNAEDCR